MNSNVKAYLDSVSACWHRPVKQALTLVASAALWSVTAAVQAQIPLNNVSKISAGVDTTCAIVNGSGAAQCWGAKHYTEDSGPANSPMPVAHDIPIAGSAVAEMVVGADHSCVRTTAGGVKCWGQNFYGQLGDNTTTGHPHAAADVVGLASGVTAIAAGLNHLCALTSAGAVKCWGRNESGQLGNNSTTNSLVPVTVVGLEQGVVAIAARGSHSCAVLGNGSVQCWGSNSLNELGNGTFTQSAVPVEVPYLGGVQKIAAGDNHNCALVFDGSVKCWGANDNGQSGSVVGLPYILIPISVQNLSNVVELSASGKRTCALSITGPLMNGGAVKCWGSNLDSTGVQGANASSYSDAAVDVPGWGSGITAIAAGNYHTCALNTAGIVSCFGWNPSNQLGDNTTVQRLNPVATLQAFAPEISMVSPGDTRAVVRFNPPANDSGSPVTGYTVTTTPAGGIDSHAGTTNSYYGPNELSHLITSLVNGTNYGFRITATNALGTGQLSNVVYATPAAINCNNGPVVRGGTYSGTLNAADCTDSAWGAAYYTKRYVYNANAGDQIALQTYTGGRIYLIGLQGVAGMIGQRLPGSSYFTLTYSGPYIIEVASYDVGVSANYSFSVLAPGIGSSTSAATSSSSSRSSSSNSSTSSSATSSIAASISTSRSSSSVISSSTSSSVTTSASSLAVSTSSTATSSSSASSVNNCGAPVISIGSTYNGSLSASDCTAGTRGSSYYTDYYAFSGSAGQQIFVQLTSSVFDTYVYLRYLGSGGAVLASNDDSGGTTNSRIPVTSGYFTLPTTGAYLVEVTSYATLNTGAYTMSLLSGSASSSSSSNSSAATGCVTTNLSFGLAANGALAATDCTNGARGTAYYTDRYSFYATAGQQISILLTSTAFDSYVYLKNSSGTVMTSNDDGGGGTNSRIPATSGTYTMPATAAYTIEVTSYSTQVTGAYTLQLN